MESSDREMTLRDYWRVVRARKWIVIVAVVVSVGGALGLALSQTPVYETSAQVIVQPRQSGGLFQSPGGVVVTNDRAVQTEIRVIEGETVRERVQDDVGLEEPPPGVDASAVGQTDVIAVGVRNTDPVTAQVLANAYAQAYIDVRREQAVGELLAASAEVQNTITDIQVQVDQLAEDDSLRTVLVAQQAAFRETLNQLQVDAALRTGGASIITPAELPSDPVEPTPLRSAVLAGVVGLLIGLGAAFLKDYLDDAVRTEEDLERVVGLPVLAVIPVDPPPDHWPIAVSRPEDYAVETYRGLRTNVQFLGIERTLRILQVTSSVAGEGKTTTATNLAVVLAQAGKRVFLVDADLRRPRLHEVFAVQPSPGLTDLIVGEVPGLVVHPLVLNDNTRLDVVPAGNVPPNPGEMLSGARLGEIVGSLAGSYEYVILDSAPVLPVADSVALSTVADGVLVVAQAGRASSKNVHETIERLQRVGAPIIGLVLNQASAKSPGGYGYGYSYGYDQRGKSAPPTPTRA